MFLWTSQTTTRRHPAALFVPAFFAGFAVIAWSGIGTAAEAETPVQDTPAVGDESPPSNSGKKPSEPGVVEVDEEAAERALERTLVAGGALLLPFGQAEFEPAFNYTRRDNDVPVAVIEAAGIGATGDEAFLGSRNVKRNEFTPSADLRIGLPFDAQFEIGLPYNIVQQEIQPSDDEDTGHAIGDLRVGIAKTLVREKGWVPDVIARVIYDSNTGDKDDNGVALDGGFNDVSGQVVALKRQDPLAFVASTSYEYTFEDDDIRPGDELNFTLGALLAASPETTLRAQLQQSFINDVKVNGRVINGSDQTQGVMILGASSILGRGVLLDVATGIGLTDDAPDYFVTVSLPIRFDLPIPQ
jgi:hypothetical protein